MTEIIEQMKFCNQLQGKLTEAVVLHENCRCTLDTPYHCKVAEYGIGIVERGASKTQIRASIVQLRRELNVLSKMFDDRGE